MAYPGSVAMLGLILSPLLVRLSLQKMLRCSPVTRFQTLVLPAPLSSRVSKPLSRAAESQGEGVPLLATAKWLPGDVSYNDTERTQCWWF